MAVIRRHPSMFACLVLATLAGVAIGYLMGTPAADAARPSASAMLQRIAQLEGDRDSADATIAELILRVETLEGNVFPQTCEPACVNGFCDEASLTCVCEAGWTGVACDVPTGGGDDADQDGWTIAQGDCNDSDPNIHPGATDATCDAVDNDCDGVADEDVAPQQSVCGLGACTANGEVICVNGSFVDTCTPHAPSQEVCDNLDNDCDGEVDEDLSQPTTCGIGQCAAIGQLVCVNGALVNTCVPGQASAEVCDGVDNDCDGEADEGAAGCPGGTVCVSGVCQ